MSQQPLDKQPVAPADARDTSKKEEGVHPAVVNPDQPLFPRPFGVSQDDLEAQGVAHAYTQPPESVEAPSGPSTEEAEGSDASGAPEGKPADPDAAEKAKAAAEVAEKNRVTQTGQTPPTGSPTGGQAPKPGGSGS